MNSETNVLKQSLESLIGSISREDEALHSFREVRVYVRFSAVTYLHACTCEYACLNVQVCMRTSMNMSALLSAYGTAL